MNPDPKDRPNTIPWPPILLVGALVAVNILGALAPLPFSLGDVGQLLGWSLVTLAILLMGWAFLTFRRNRANILPHRAADRLLTGGPFRFSRNPIYLSEAWLLAGLGLLNGSLWYWAAVPLFMLAITRLAIQREEAHMEARFGEAWTAYAASVRRWM